MPVPLSNPYLPLTDRIFMVPVAHGLQVYADEVRRAVHLLQPDCIAVELPRALRAKVMELVGHLPEVRVLAFKVPNQPAFMIPADPCDSLIEAVRLAIEHDIPLEFVDTVEGGRNDQLAFLPDELAIADMGVADFATRCLASMEDAVPTERERVMAGRLYHLQFSAERILFVGGMGHFKPLQKMLQDVVSQEAFEDVAEPVPITKIKEVKEKQLGLVLMEIPYVAYLYETFRSSSGPEDRFPMLKALQRVLQRGAEVYAQEYDEKVNLTEWRALYQYGRNLSLVRGRLRPQLYELLTAAKGCVDDDFGAICLEEAVSYPPNHREAEPLDPSELEPESEPGPRHLSLHLYEEFDGATERLEHAYPYPDATEMSFTFKRRRRPTEAQKAYWKEAFRNDLWTGSSICSWPPEDEFIEGFFRAIRQRAFQLISEAHTNSEEFTSSILDGLDVRETMRRWHDKKLFVKRERLPPGRVGPVVLIWKDLPLEDRSVWRTVLYAENSNESDIAFFSRKLGEEMIGPGISRTEYHGILSVYPSSGIPDVWRIPLLERWRSSARLLLVSAILLSQERYIAYVDKSPPDAEVRQFARLHRKAIIFIPISTFSRTLLKRARQCHILASRKARGWAGDYIPEI